MSVDQTHVFFDKGKKTNSNSERLSFCFALPKIKTFSFPRKEKEIKKKENPSNSIHFLSSSVNI